MDSTGRNPPPRRRVTERPATYPTPPRRSVTERPATYPTTAAPPLRINPTPPRRSVTERPATYPTPPRRNVTERPATYPTTAAPPLRINPTPPRRSVTERPATYPTPPEEAPGNNRRGRPSGAFGTGVDGITAHLIQINAGQDIAEKIVAFSQEASRTVCIRSANGAVSRVMLKPHATSPTTICYEGRYEILSLTGSYSAPSISLVGPDFRVLDGVVAGVLIAATRVQVVLGTEPLAASQGPLSVDLGLSLAPPSVMAPLSSSATALPPSSGGGHSAAEPSLELSLGPPSLEPSLGLPSLELSLGVPSSSSGSSHGIGMRIIYVDAGEDIAARIMAFSTEICTSFSIISASGVVRSVTLSGVPIPREGPFEIVTLSGSFILEEGGDIGVHGALRVCLAGSDHRPFGGIVAGALIAATPIQVIVGTFARG